MKSESSLSPSRAIAVRVLFAALTVLKERGGELPLAEIKRELEKRLRFAPHELEVYASNGLPRWLTVLHFFSIDAVKAGFLVKKRGIWFLTPEGEKALQLGETGLLAAAQMKYREWRRTKPRESEPESTGDQAADAEPEGREAEADLDEIQSRALSGFKSFLETLNPYEFQELIAALLRAMGYHTPFVAPRGKDGGIDVIAYRDPLGTLSPRIKVQIKHRENTANVQEVRQLIGVLSKDGEVGLFVSTGGFTSEARVAARSSHVHVELIDLERFIAMWQEFYPKMTDEDRSRLPLVPVNFLAPRS